MRSMTQTARVDVYVVTIWRARCLGELQGHGLGGTIGRGADLF